MVTTAYRNITSFQNVKETYLRPEMMKRWFYILNNGNQQVRIMEANGGTK